MALSYCNQFCNDRHGRSTSCPHIDIERKKLGPAVEPIVRIGRMGCCHFSSNELSTRKKCPKRFHLCPLEKINLGITPGTTETHPLRNPALPHQQTPWCVSHGGWNRQIREPIWTFGSQQRCPLFYNLNRRTRHDKQLQ